MVPLLRRWALERQVLDIPDHRKVHVTPVPRLGGVAVFLSVLLSMLVFTDINDQVRGILSGGLVLFITGLIDDLYGLSPKKKFMGQIAACVITMAVGNLYIAHLGNLFGQGDIVLPLWLAFPFTLFAVVGVINALNLLDGLDGLAGGFAVIALGAFLLLGCQQGNLVTISLCLALLGGLLGFLKFNTHPASIFMGDSGSLTVGFFLGFLAVMIARQPVAGAQPVVPLVILGFPIFDTLRVMGKRIFRGESPFVADQTHTHHKFLDLGLSHRFAVLAIYGLTLLGTTMALLFQQGPEYLLLGAYIACMFCFYLTLRLIIRYKQRPFFSTWLRLAQVFVLSQWAVVDSNSKATFAEEEEINVGMTSSQAEQQQAA
jgi:UDP-GlcNAc:undecaprenyl-phosphate GlcNAc-1-phosphate transferase